MLKKITTMEVNEKNERIVNNYFISRHMPLFLGYFRFDEMKLFIIVFSVIIVSYTVENFI